MKYIITAFILVLVFIIYYVFLLIIDWAQQGLNKSSDDNTILDSQENFWNKNKDDELDM